MSNRAGTGATQLATTVLATGLMLAACAAPDGASGAGGVPGDEAIGAVVAPRLSSTWVGYRLGASPGRWTDRGRLQPALPTAEDESLSGGETVVPLKVRVDDSLASVPRPARETVVMGASSMGRVYEIDMRDADRGLIARHLEQLGVAAGNDGDDHVPSEGPSPDDAIVDPAADDALVPRSWSFGRDDRKPYGVHEWGATPSPLNRVGTFSRTIGTKTYLCTATFVGTPTSGYFIVTAAHCFWKPGTGEYLDPDFYPRRDGCKRPDGTTITGCKEQPYGKWDGLGWLMPTYFYENCRGQSQITRECAASDIAIQQVGRPSGVSFPGAMGFYPFRFSELSSLSKILYGYPSCSAPGHPEPCRPYTLYRDPTSGSCTLGEASQTDGDGWHQLVQHGCDTSSGQSGASMYVNSPGAKVFGVVTSDEGCFATCKTQATPSYIRRITPAWYDSMLSFMGQ